MHILEFTINQQILTWTNPCRVPVEKTKGWLYARFAVDSEWDGMNITAIFRHSTQEPVEVPLTEDLIEVPKEVILHGYLFVGLVGRDAGGTIQLTTQRMLAPVPLQPATSTSGKSPDNIPLEAWEQVLGSIGDLSKLDTTAKNNIVAAINEIYRAGGGNTGGNISSDEITTIKVLDRAEYESLPTPRPATTAYLIRG